MGTYTNLTQPKLPGKTTDQGTRSPHQKKKAVSNPTKNEPSDDLSTSVTDVVTSVTDGDPSEKRSQIDPVKLITVIKSLSEISASTQNTPVRFSEQEKKDIEDFIFITLRKNGLQGKAVSTSKLLRYSLRYLMKVHQKEFITALQKALKKNTLLPI
jgi:hypothetical protein